MTRVMPRRTKWSQTGGMRRAPTDQTCLDILGGMTPGYSVAIVLPLYEVLLLIDSYRKHPCLWNSTVKYYKCKNRLK